MMNRDSQLARRAAVALLIAAAGCADEPEEAPADSDRPDVLLVTLDTTRADALGCYGGPEWASPALDAIARRGARFDSARATAPITLPSHATLFTGTLPFQHGVRDNGTFRLADAATTLAERLAEAGYRTVGIPAATVLDAGSGIGQGFDRFVDLPITAESRGEDASARGAAEIADLAAREIDALEAGTPLFLWVHFFDPHFPYDPPPELLARHPPPAEGAERGARRREIAHRYQLEVTAADAGVGRILDQLARAGRLERTVIVVVGDHGEGLGEHGEASHSVLVHDATLRVPLLMAHPSIPAGVVIAEPVSIADVMPTLLSLLRIPAPGAHGADLGPLLRGGTLAAERALYFETCATWFTSGWAPLYGVIDGRFKVVLGPQPRVFDLEADPHELTDVSDRHEEVLARAKETILGFGQQTVDASRRDLGADETRALHSLGYIVTAESERRGGLVPPGWQPEGALAPEQGLENLRRFTQANQAWREGRRDEGMAQLLELAAEEPGNPRYAEVAAALLVAAGRAEEALPLARRGIELAENPGLRATLVSALLSLRRFDEALKEALLSVELYPRDATACITCSQILIESGRGADAVPILEAFLREPGATDELRERLRALLARARGA